MGFRNIKEKLGKVCFHSISNIMEEYANQNSISTSIQKTFKLKKRSLNRQNQNGILNYFFNDIEIAGRTKTFFLQIFLYHFKEKKCK